MGIFALISWVPCCLFEYKKWPAAQFGVIFTLFLARKKSSKKKADKKVNDQQEAKEEKEEEKEKEKEEEKNENKGD